MTITIDTDRAIETITKTLHPPYLPFALFRDDLIMKALMEARVQPEHEEITVNNGGF